MARQSVQVRDYMAEVTPWVRSVGRCREISDTVRAQLLFMAMRAQYDGRRFFVSVPLQEMADTFNTSGRRILGRIKQAKDAGHLDVKARGNRGRTAEYWLTYPDKRVTATSTLSKAERVTPSTLKTSNKGATGRHPITKARLGCQSCLGQGCSLCEVAS
jgi:hypothetical protein